MPINGLWTIRMAVTRRMPEDTDGEPVVLPGKGGNNNTTATDTSNAEATAPSADGGGGEEFNHDPTDWVSVRMGPSLTSLHHVADVKNVVNDDLGEVRRFCSCRVVKRSMSALCIIGQWEARSGVLSNRERSGAISTGKTLVSGQR